MHPFEATVLALGALLMVGALLSGWAHRTFVSLTAVFVVAGFLLGEGGLEVLEFDPQSDFVKDLAIVALVVLLFRDGLEVEEETLRGSWHLPLRKLVLAMPVTGALVALCTAALTDLGWAECFLVGALLSPTDPVLSSSVVTNPRVPLVVRHSLNLESGLNDGLALPAVLVFLAAAGGGEDDFVWWQFVLQDITLGLAFGLAMGFLGSWLMPRTGKDLREDFPPHAKSLYALGLAFATYGVAVVSPEGNGLIAVFVCAIVVGLRRPDLHRAFVSRSDDVVEIVKLAVFVVFGALLTLGGLFEDAWAAAAIAFVALFVARPVAIWMALAGTGQPVYVKAFMAWFGPRGVATMAFSLLVLASGIEDAERIFYIAALAVFASILLHGSTDTAGVGWIERKARPQE